MNSHFLSNVAKACLPVTVLFTVLLAAGCGHRNASVPAEYSEEHRCAAIYPDYAGVVVPPNIAPMNLIVHEGAGEYVVRLSVQGSKAQSLAVATGEDGKVDFPETEWHSLLSSARGNNLSMEIFANKDGKWLRFEPQIITVAAEPIDSYVSYRLIEPGYEVYRQIGLYQRNLTNFTQTAIYENNRKYDEKNNHCVNCHNFQNYSTRNMLFHIRGQHGGTMLVSDGKARKMNMKSDSILSSTVYPTWHPRRKWVVFSSNITGQAFHTLDKQKIEVMDLASDLVFFDAENGKLSNILKTTDDLETFPCWSPDGSTLYYCSAHIPGFSNIPDSMRTGYIEQHYRDLHYNIMKMSFDENTREFGKPQMVLDCEAMGKSATVPRVSPDGKYLLFTLGDYGQFHIWHRSADLYVMRLPSMEVSPLSEANSPNTESYHAWSSNGRWIVFTSRRDDGSFTRLYISYFDAAGHAHKPFLLPQRDPEQNTLLLKSYNVPELTKDPVSIPAAEFKKIIYNTEGIPVKYGK